MRFGQLLYPLGLAAAAVAKLSDRAPEDAGTLMVDLNDEAYEALRALEEGSPEKRSSCNIFTATIRRDWLVPSFMPLLLLPSCDTMLTHMTSGLR
jgi:hypothetical protein